MLKNFIYGLCLLFFLISCEKDENPGSLEHRLYSQSALMEVEQGDGQLDYQLTEGNSLVFHYAYTHPEDPKVDDDELLEVLLWEFDPQIESFKIVDFTEVKAYYQRLCFCDTRQFHDISGTIEGKMLDNCNWEVYIDVAVETSSGTEEIEANNIYKRSQRPD